MDNDVYVIPGIETTLGGCRHYDNYDLNVDKHISAQIWENCTNLLPSLKDAVVIREWVGLRPHRIPIRLESEIMEIDGVKLKVYIFETHRKNMQAPAFYIARLL